jgi:hypothetical protein
MSKITNVRLPNATSFRFDPQQFNQLVRSLEQVILQLNATYTPVTTEDKDQAQSWFFSGTNIVSRQEVNSKVNKSGDTMTGNLTVPSLTSGSITLGAWVIEPSGTKLLFKYSGNTLGSLDSTGNFTVTGNVTGFGTP